jgi:hypothetical protein
LGGGSLAMTLETLGDVGAFVGSVAIIISLLYLAPSLVLSRNDLD